MRVITWFGVIVAVVVLWAGCDGDKPLVPIPEPPKTTGATTAVWSTHGNVIALVWNGMPDVHRRGIYLLDTLDWSLDTVIALAGWAGTFGPPAFSPSGKWLIFSYNAQIYKITANGDSLTQLTFSERQWFCDWSQSDTLIAFVASSGDSEGLWAMTIFGDNQRYLVSNSGSCTFMEGDSVLIHEWVPGSTDSAHIVAVNPIDTGRRVILTWEVGKPYHFYSDLDYGLANGRIALSIEGNIWLMERDGGELTQLTLDGGRYPSWSPDGRAMVYSKPTVGGGEIWIMKSDGSDKRLVPSWTAPSEEQ